MLNRIRSKNQILLCPDYKEDTVKYSQLLTMSRIQMSEIVEIPAVLGRATPWYGAFAKSAFLCFLLSHFRRKWHTTAENSSPLSGFICLWELADRSVSSLCYRNRDRILFECIDSDSDSDSDLDWNKSNMYLFHKRPLPKSKP